MVLHDALIDPALREMAPQAEWIDVGKRGFCDSTAQARINALLVQHARAGGHVVRLKGGDPSVFGRLDEELEALAEAGIACEVVPGVTAAIAAAADLQAPADAPRLGPQRRAEHGDDARRPARGHARRRHRGLLHGRPPARRAVAPPARRRLAARDAGGRRVARRLARPARQRPPRRHAGRGRRAARRAADGRDRRRRRDGAGAAAPSPLAPTAIALPPLPAAAKP